MKIGVLGLGTWGFCLARHLAINGHTVIGWTKEAAVLAALRRGDDHPTLHRSCRGMSLQLTDSLQEAITGVDMIVESVTTGGLREVLQKVSSHTLLKTPLVLTSKGIEQVSFLTPPEVAYDIFDTSVHEHIAMLSGPSFALEVAGHLPTAVVCGCKNAATCDRIVEAFTGSTFRVYPNSDILGVAIGGAMKNVIAIACGIAEGLGLGTGARASVVTRGLHEIVKLATALGCQPSTLYGLSGLGDLYLTCSSSMSRNFRFGQLISSGLKKDDAVKNIGMVVEGAYTCHAAKKLAQKMHVQMPINSAICDILDGSMPVAAAAENLMQRAVKEERL
jgi:glycerol-3-phosphate dehydrogenase (NAD(P)+)